MQINSTFAVVFTVVISGQLMPMTANAATDNEHAITRVETDLNDALMACDAKALGRLWAEDMTFVFPNGVAETRKQRLDGLSTCVPGAQRSTIETITITDLGESVSALVLSNWTATFNGKPFAAKFRATHVWARRAGAWVLVAAHVSQLK